MGVESGTISIFWAMMMDIYGVWRTALSMQDSYAWRERRYSVTGIRDTLLFRFDEISRRYFGSST
jgi:hypothetical protein